MDNRSAKSVGRGQGEERDRGHARLLHGRAQEEQEVGAQEEEGQGGVKGNAEGGLRPPGAKPEEHENHEAVGHQDEHDRDRHQLLERPSGGQGHRHSAYQNRGCPRCAPGIDPSERAWAETVAGEAENHARGHEKVAVQRGKNDEQGERR